jgi:putative selenate reductase
MHKNFAPIPFRDLFKLTINQLNAGQFFGLPAELFYNPQQCKFLKTSIFGQEIDNCIGVAAGPHTQLAQNIVAAWLCGARFIELKTVQTLDRLEISKPCIDMQDEGYNCEWSQELTLEQSFNQYLEAWVLVHVLNHKLFYNKPLNTIFNLSAGYNLEGILKQNVQWFLQKMRSCPNELSAKINEIADLYPAIYEIEIPASISDNLTLSTMHGCPPNEIFDIAKYLLEIQKLHTTVKLNPTLLGKDMLLEILNTIENFEAEVPDLAFEHDLKWTDAVELIKSLQKIAKENKLHFGIKLSNTLEVTNHKNIFAPENQFMYLSGRALHPITIQLAQKVRKEFGEELSISFSAGVDYLNIADVLKCGFSPVTVCSDLLKPGGYGRLAQYFSKLKKSEAEFLAGTFYNPEYLAEYSQNVLQSNHYKREYFSAPSIKTNRPLGQFDCIEAPCISNCATNQDIPGYLHQVENENYEDALQIILKDNPLPAITGMICDHLCQLKCTRINYDSSLKVREIKRFVAENARFSPVRNIAKTGKVAIIGAGPAGLSCAYYLSINGFQVEIFEQNESAGGLVQEVIPSFRLSAEAILTDIKRVKDLGVQIHFNQKIDSKQFESIQQLFHYVFVAVGTPKSIALELSGNATSDLVDPLQFLKDVKRGQIPDLGNHVAIIGGGNTAMDAARVAKRLVGTEGKVTLIYRRTKKEMPADLGEINAALAENIQFLELTVPETFNKNQDGTFELVCSKMKLAETDKSGRRKPIKIEGSDFSMQVSAVIPAIGQEVCLDFLPNGIEILREKPYQTSSPQIFVGGDAMRGGATAIKAIADGKNVAKKICFAENIPFTSANIERFPISYNELQLKRFQRTETEVDITENHNKAGFSLETRTLTAEEAQREAKRCLHCEMLCNICTTVCPNLANFPYQITQGDYAAFEILQKDKQIIISELPVFSLKQNTQILHIANWCNACGNCETFCPTQSAPFKEKPAIYISKDSFDVAEKAYFYEIAKDFFCILGKESGQISSLKWKKDEYIYQNEKLTIHFDRNFKIKHYQILTIEDCDFNTIEVIKLAQILKGCGDFFLK